jgi:hypothetical protein
MWAVVEGEGDAGTVDAMRQLKRRRGAGVDRG